MNESPLPSEDPLSEHRVYRFSDVVNAIDSTPKSLRRWLETLDYKAPEGKWAAFTSWHVFQFALMRQLVDWGVPVVNAAELSKEVIFESVLGATPTEENLRPMDPIASLQTVTTLEELATKHLNDFITFRKVRGEYEYDFDFYHERPKEGLRGKRRDYPRILGFSDANLVIRPGLVAYHVARRLGEAGRIANVVGELDD
ncbi:hypothetical protein OB03_07500 [Brevundimonas sp. GN22]